MTTRVTYIFGVFTDDLKHSDGVLDRSCHRPGYVREMARESRQRGS